MSCMQCPKKLTVATLKVCSNFCIHELLDNYYFLRSPCCSNMFCHIIDREFIVLMELIGFNIDFQYMNQFCGFAARFSPQLAGHLYDLFMLTGYSVSSIVICQWSGGSDVQPTTFEMCSEFLVCHSLNCEDKLPFCKSSSCMYVVSVVVCL